MKRIVTVQDFSCLGKCSLTVALPVLSAMGIECAPLPSALLSAHTAFDGFYSRPLTGEMQAILKHWSEIKLRFDGICSGYLASEEQAELICKLFEQMDMGMRFVDPVMADQGKLYTGFSSSFPQAMKELCRHAQVITPNVTEACLLTETPYGEYHSEVLIRTLLEKLLDLGVDTAIITGLRPDEGHMAVASLQKTGEYHLHLTKYVPAMLHGTGDLFAAVCAGALVLGRSAPAAAALAADYVNRTIEVTMKDPQHPWYGVDFETTLPYLIQQMSTEEDHERF